LTKVGVAETVEYFIQTATRATPGVHQHSVPNSASTKRDSTV